MPALRARGTGVDFGDVEQAVTAGAGELGSVPFQECLRGTADAGRVRDEAEADGAALALIGQGPTEREDVAEEQTVGLEGCCCEGREIESAE